MHIASDFIAQREPDQAGGLLGDKAHSFWCDNSKIKRFVPGYTATIPLHEGIRRTIAWFEAKPARRAMAAGTMGFPPRCRRASRHRWRAARRFYVTASCFSGTYPVT